MTVEYLNGSDVTVIADGVTVGGVLSAECGQQNEVERIEEYLTDVPVAQLPVTSYYIKLRMRVQPYGSLGLNPDEVVLQSGARRVTYRRCAVESVKCEILPRLAVEYTVTLSAGERSETND